MRNWTSLAKIITLKPALISLHDSLAALVRYSQAQNCLRTKPKPLQKVSVELKKTVYLTEFYAD